MLFNRIYKEKRFDVTDKTSSVILSKWKALNLKFADRMQEKSELLSSKTKSYVLVLFCVLSGGSSIAIIVNSVTTKTTTIKIASISKPAHANDKEQSILEPDSIITKQAYNRVLQFEEYMLNLRKDSVGKVKYDSMINSRPQLMDSIALFKKMYLSQNKK